MLRRFVLAIAAALAWSACDLATASAQEHQANAGQREARERDERRGDRDGDKQHRRRSIPEFDPLTVGVIAAVVAGGGVLIARRRRN